MRKTPRAESRPDERSLGTKIIIRRVSERNLNEFEILLKNGETLIAIAMKISPKIIMLHSEADPKLYSFFSDE